MEIDYRRLKETIKNELESDNLTDLDADFFSLVREYLREVNFKKPKNELHRELLEKQIDVATKISEELFKIRLQKTLNLVILGDMDQFNNVLTKEEKFIFEKVSELIQKEKNITIETKSLRDKKSMYIKDGTFIKILDKIPKILGVDKREYGPFNPQDMIIMPKENAKTLIKRSVAEQINLN